MEPGYPSEDCTCEEILLVDSQKGATRASSGDDVDILVRTFEHLANYKERKYPSNIYIYSLFYMACRDNLTSLVSFTEEP